MRLLLRELRRMRRLCGKRIVVMRRTVEVVIEGGSRVICCCGACGCNQRLTGGIRGKGLIFLRVRLRVEVMGGAGEGGGRCPGAKNETSPTPHPIVFPATATTSREEHRAHR